jgi:hypothetical protein
VSTRMSPDGMYYWDGQQWLSTLSHDGRNRWNGSAWIPTGQAPGATGYYQPPATVRQPTSWTRPLQYAVAGWYAVEAVYSLTLPFWMSGAMTQAINQGIQRQQQLNPQVSPPPADVTSMISSMMSGMLWVGAFFGVAISAVAIIGALKRWTWVYYVVLVLLGFGALSLPLNLINLATGSAVAALSSVSVPAWSLWVGVALSIPSTALFVWMLVALVKRGPWAMKREAPALS